MSIAAGPSLLTKNRPRLDRLLSRSMFSGARCDHSSRSKSVKAFRCPALSVIAMVTSSPMPLRAARAAWINAFAAALVRDVHMQAKVGKKNCDSKALEAGEYDLALRFATLDQCVRATQVCCIDAPDIVVGSSADAAGVDQIGNLRQ